MTHRGHIRQSYGGVGRNIGDALARLGCRPLLISAVGDDTHARALTAHNPKLELGGLARVGGASTAVYCVVLDQAGEALFGVGDMSVHERVTPGHVSQFEDEICCSPLVILDGNMPLSTIGYVLDLCSSCGVPGEYKVLSAFTPCYPEIIKSGTTLNQLHENDHKSVTGYSSVQRHQVSFSPMANVVSPSFWLLSSTSCSFYHSFKADLAYALRIAFGVTGELQDFGFNCRCDGNELCCAKEVFNLRSPS
ncbi:pseudouridine kinase [Penaeus vannamei]|uniref:pseudouridine kinase n=1 Tax=Penaeus vannamei TaxID=6689 RepID=UPI00387F587D